MAKKSQSKPGADGASNPPPHVPNRDLMQRMNFLYQASVCLQGSTGEQKSASSELQRIARKHVKTLKGIASGAVVKIDPSVKRMLCKGCNAILVPGSTASVRVKTSRPHGKSISYSCFSCRTVRVIPAPPTTAPQSQSRQPARHDADHMVQAPQAHADAAQLNSSRSEDALNEGPIPTNNAPMITEGTDQFRPKHKRRRSKARPLPFFARVDAGHVVFRGAERVGGDD